MTAQTSEDNIHEPAKWG